MTKEYERLCVSKQTYDLVTKECVDEYLRENPNVDKDDLNITHEFIVKRIAQYYLQ